MAEEAPPPLVVTEPLLDAIRRDAIESFKCWKNEATEEEKANGQKDF